MQSNSVHIRLSRWFYVFGIDCWRNLGILLFNWNSRLKHNLYKWSIIWIAAQCPNNARPYINSLSNRPQKCTVGVTLCNAVGYRCMSRDANSLIGFCCSIDVETNIINEQHQIGTDIHRRTAAINSIDALRTIGDVYRKHILQISSYMTTSPVPTNEIVDKSSSNTIEYKPDIRIVGKLKICRLLLVASFRHSKTNRRSILRSSTGKSSMCTSLSISGHTTAVALRSVQRSMSRFKWMSSITDWIIIARWIQLLLE